MSHICAELWHYVAFAAKFKLDISMESDLLATGKCEHMAQLY